jgi:PIN domain nuclease of toxin-antitoxin system
MRLLLDTHTFLWLAADSPELSERARAAFLDPGNELRLSLASVWEIAIKASLGKLVLRTTVDSLVREAVQQRGIALLPIELAHVLRVRDLPFHHRDPFDRLLVAQAESERLTILGRDEAFDRYGVTRVW